MEEKTFTWTDEANERANRVPEGFMRNMTRKNIEEHAATKNIFDITLEVAEEAINSSRAGMGSMMGGDMEMPAGMPDHVKKMLQANSSNGKEEKPKTVFYFCFVCNFAVPEKVPETCPNCGSESEKFSLLEEQYKTSAHTVFLEWTINSEKYLETIPDGFRRKMSKNEIEAFSRREGYKVVTRDVIDERLKVWGDISKKMTSEMEWDAEVHAKIEKIPAQIRGMVIKEMEKFAKSANDNIVTASTLDKIREKWMNSKEFHVKWQ